MALYVICNKTVLNLQERWGVDNNEVLKVLKVYKVLKVRKVRKVWKVCGVKAANFSAIASARNV